MASLRKRAQDAVGNKRETKKPSLGRVPSSFSPEEQKFLQAVKETVEVNEGQKGSYLDKGVRIRDLIDPDFLSFLNEQPLSVINKQGISGDTTPPHPPRDFVVTPLVFSVQLTWTNPDDADFAAIEVWRVEQVKGTTAPTSSSRGNSAYAVVTAPQAQYQDTAVLPDMDYYYWIRSKDYAGNCSTFVPADATAKVTIDSVGPMIDNIINLLTGQITELQLYDALNTKINLIATNQTNIGVHELRITAGENGDWSTAYVTQVQYVADPINNPDTGYAVAQEILWAGTTGTGTPTSDPPEPGTLMAMHTIKLNVNGYIAGYGLSLEPDGQDPTAYTSSFIVLADRFAVVTPDSPAGEPGSIPFIIGKVDGIDTVGVNGNLVVDGTILADAISCDYLSAIVANLGDITSGLLHDVFGKSSRFENTAYFNLDAAENETCLQIGKWMYTSYTPAVNASINISIDIMGTGSFPRHGYGFWFGGQNYQFISNGGSASGNNIKVDTQGLTTRAQYCKAIKDAVNLNSTVATATYYELVEGVISGVTFTHETAGSAGNIAFGTNESVLRLWPLSSTFTGGVNEVLPTQAHFRGFIVNKNGEFFSGNALGHWIYYNGTNDDVNINSIIIEPGTLHVNGDIIATGNIKAHNLTERNWAVIDDSTTSTYLRVGGDKEVQLQVSSNIWLENWDSQGEVVSPNTVSITLYRAPCNSYGVTTGEYANLVTQQFLVGHKQALTYSTFFLNNPPDTSEYFRYKVQFTASVTTFAVTQNKILAVCFMR